MATYNYTVTASGNDHYLWNGHGLVDAQNPDLFFRAGDKVTITNASGGHPMRITNNAAPSVGIIDESGGQIVVDPVTEGTFTYFCTSHPSAMTGSVTVSRAYANEGPEDGYGTGPLIGHDDGPLSMNEIRTKINEIITKGGVGGGGSISVSTDAPGSPSDGDLWWDEDTASLYVYFEDRDAWIQTNGAVSGGGSGIDFYSGTFHGEDQSADDHVIIIPVPSNGKCGGVLELSDYSTSTDQDEGGMLSWNFDATTGEIKMQQCWSGGNSTYLKSNSVTATLTNTYQSIDISMPYQLVAWGVRYRDGSLYLSSDAHIGVWQATVSSGGGGGAGGGTPAGSDRELQFNDNGTFGSNPDLSIDTSGNLSVPRLAVGVGNFAGDEGGEMALRQSETNNTLVGNWIYMDSHKNLIRFFEDGPPYKGAYIDLSECADGVGTNLLAGGGGGGGAVYDSGWIAATANSNTTFNHNLGGNDIQAQVYHATSSSGANASIAGDILDSSGNQYGARVHSITDSSLIVRTGTSVSTSQWGNNYVWAGNYIRVIAIKGGGGGSAVQAFQISTPLNFTSRNIHTANFAGSLYGEKLSVSDFTETANTIGGASYQIDQAAGSGGFKMFKVPSSGGPYLIEVNGVVYDADAGSGDRFTLGLYTCDSETGVTAETDNSVAMTEVAVGYNTGGSSTSDKYGVCLLQTSNVIANGKFFYLRINSIDGGSAGYVTAKVKVTNLSGGGSGGSGGGGGGGGEWFVLNQTLTNHLAGSSSNISSVTDLGTGKSRINFVNSYSSSTSYGIGVVSDEASSSSVYVYLTNTTASSFELWNRVADSFRDAEDLRAVIFN